MSFLTLDRITKRFGDVQVLTDLSLNVDRGEVLALLGLSGSGKTTALRLIAGFETPDAGRIAVAGHDVTQQPPAARDFGMVFQHYALFPHMTVAENVAFGLATRKMAPEAQAERVREVLGLVDLEAYGARRIDAISGGQQQRVALARALAPSPRVLLLDEPLSNLDPALRERTRRELRAAIAQVGITTVLVTHEQEEAFDVGDRVAVLHQGRLEQVADARTLYRQPASQFVATFVGHASTVPARVIEGSSPDDPSRVHVDVAGSGTVWRASSHEEIATGTPVTLVVRPESLALVAPAAPDPSAGEAPANADAPQIDGEVTAVRFTGPATYAVVRLARAATGTATEIGDPVEIEVLVADNTTTPSVGQPVAVAQRRSRVPVRVYTSPGDSPSPGNQSSQGRQPSPGDRP